MDKNKNFDELDVFSVNPLKEFYTLRGLRYRPKPHIIGKAIVDGIAREAKKNKGGKHE